MHRTKKINLFSFFTFIAVLTFWSLVYGQSTSVSKKKDNVLFKEQDFAPIDMKSQAEKRIYQRVPLEDFETNDYTHQQMHFRWVDHKHADISIRSEYPAPIKDSKKYLGVKVFGKREDAVYIYPAKAQKYIPINNYCKRINIWAYGKGLSGTLYLVLKDSKDNTHHLRFGQLSHRGWKLMSMSIPSTVHQQDYFLNQRTNLRIIALVYNPGNKGQQNQWSYIYLDDMTAVIRGKYTDRQSDDW